MSDEETRFCWSDTNACICGNDCAGPHGPTETGQERDSRIWQEGWNAGFRDSQAGRIVDGYMEIDPRPNPYARGLDE